MSRIYSWREDYWGAEPKTEKEVRCDYLVGFYNGHEWDHWGSYQDRETACKVSRALSFQKGFLTQVWNNDELIEEN